MNLDDALAAAEDRLLVALLVHHTAETRWLDEFRALGVSAQDPSAADEKTATVLRQRLHSAVARLSDDLYQKKPLPDDQVIQQLIRFVTGTDLQRGYLDKLKTDFGFDNIRSIAPGTAPDIIIVGGGFSGVAMAIELHKRQIPFRLLERHSGVGGVWFENSYPGCGVDSPSHVYSLAANAASPGWSRYFARRDEILAYFDRTTREFALTDSIEFDRSVTSMSWTGSGWSIAAESADGTQYTYHCAVAISAVGTLNQPKTPDIPGIEKFDGDVFHTARWQPDVDLEGKRVAMIGNGSSGFQVGPHLAKTASHLVSFQRSPAWASPNPRVGTAVDAATNWLLTRMPDYSLWHRFAMYWGSGDAGYPNLTVDPQWTGRGISAANEKVRDRLTTYLKQQLAGRPDLISKLLPDYPPYTKRLVVDNGWYEALRRDNVELVTERIECANAKGLLTSDGQHYDLDVIIFATGFYGTRFLYPVSVTGVDGLAHAEVTGHDDDIRAYMGVAMPGFPNLFSVFGPNSSIGHGGSAIHISECQAHYIAECITMMIDRGARKMEVSQAACADYNVGLDADMQRMVWTQPGIDSRYRNAQGRIVTNHPWTLQHFWELTRSPDLSHYRLTGD
jgi:4-hydroxyacetophenone monooxygenase